MRDVLRAAAAVMLVLPAAASAQQLPSGLTEVQRYTVYCADERIEVAVWDLEQMIVRRGTPVCALASYTSYGDALSFAQRNFGGEGSACAC